MHPMFQEDRARLASAEDARARAERQQALDAAEQAQRDLRMLRAQQSYAMRFGQMPQAAPPAESADALLAKLKAGRAYGWRPWYRS